MELDSVEEVIQVVVKENWTVNGVIVEHGYYGCESGCEYTTVHFQLKNGDHTDQVMGEFGCEGTETLHKEAISLAKNFGCPAVIERIYGHDGVLYNPVDDISARQKQ